MYREITNDLYKWKDSKRRKPLMIACFMCWLIVLRLLIIAEVPVKAFVPKGEWVFSNPSSISYYLDTSVSGYISSIGPFVEIWGAYCPEVSFYQTATNGNITIRGNLNVSNGTFATCVRGSGERCTITLYHSYQNLSANNQHEVIVHEVGHALGLNHCQAVYEYISVMRAVGFNNKPYPLSDDIDGISYLY
ncbi:MAG: M57 family metalloprotease [Lachnospiraceae bacterium]|nr:M57 family metalloprotease [Lachnospiraceae bacterium]